jgi:RNA polymerase sigma factor (sigma-70 family)
VKEKQDMDNTLLWQNFKEGDEKAFNFLLQEYYSVLLIYGIRLVADKNTVKDILHDFFIDLWSKREGLGDVKNLKAYLFISFRRRLFREKEKNSRLKIINETPDDYDFEVEFAIESLIIEDEIKHEIHYKLKNQLENLTKRQREAI